jgi:hypothetical protein
MQHLWEEGREEAPDAMASSFSFLLLENAANDPKWLEERISLES